MCNQRLQTSEPKPAHRCILFGLMLSKSWLSTFKNWEISHKTTDLATVAVHFHIATVDCSEKAIFQCLQGLLPSVITQVVVCNS